MLHVIDKTQWSESERNLLRKKASELNLTEDQIVERLAKLALYKNQLPFIFNEKEKP